VAISSDEVLEALGSLARMWPSRIADALESLGSPADLVWRFDGLTAEDLRTAAQQILLERRSITAADNPLAILLDRARQVQGETTPTGGPAGEPVAVPWARGVGGAIVRIRPCDLERLRLEHESPDPRGRLSLDQLGFLVGAARRWADSRTPCRECRATGDGTDCLVCRREASPIHCTVADRDLALDALGGWLLAAWRAAQNRAAPLRPPPRRSVGPGDGPVHVGTVVTEIREAGLVRTASADGRRAARA
jgi:hypothetical protein